jgi:hypothetical protein
MPVSVGTFNLNLFSRFNFEADVSTAATSTIETSTKFKFDVVAVDGLGRRTR